MTTVASPAMSPMLRFFALVPFLLMLPLALGIVGFALPSSLVLFCVLVALMLTGMPVSIALGLTVLTFLFTLTEVPIEAVALKLFTGIERFEIMAIPFFILAGTFLTHGGVARRMIDFATSLIGHWHGGLALAGILACAMFALVVRIERRDRGGDRLHHPAGDGPARLSDALRRRHHHGRRLARHPDAAVDPEDHLRDRHQHLDRRAFRGRPPARHAADDHALRRDVVPRQEAQLPDHGAGELVPVLGCVPPQHLGA